MPSPPKLPPATTIQELSRSGLTYVQIAERYGVTKYAVLMAMQRAGLRSALPRPTLAERFWAKVDKDGPLPPSRPDLGPCWLWTASDDSHGYGQFMLRTGVNVKAYRVAWELSVGPVPDGLTLDHLCRVTMCVRPAHLEPVTMRENLLRSDGMSARHARQTHCIAGHPFDEENTYRWRNIRQCRTCARRRKQEETARRRAKAA